MTASEIPAHLAKLTDPLSLARIEGSDFRFACPLCGSEDNLSVKWSEKDKRPILRCWSGCHADWRTFAAKLHELGCILPGDTATYIYRDEDGNPLYRIKRWRKDGQSRKFAEQYAKSKAGVPFWTKGVKGVNRVLYRLPDVRKGIADGATIWLVEGEKDADALAENGICATTTPFGADGKWYPSYTEALTNAEIIIVPDLDESGQGYRRALRVYSELKNVSFRITFRRAKCGKDAFDHLASGYTPDQFVGLDLDELLSLASARPEFSESQIPRDDPLPEEEWTESGYARRFSALYRESVRYVPQERCWRYWNGNYWQVDELGIVQERTRDLVRSMLTYFRTLSEKEQKALGGAKPLSFESSNRIRSILSLAETDANLASPQSVFDSDSTRIVTLSGVFDPETKTCQPATPDQLVTKCIPLEFDKSAKCPEWRKFLASSIPDEDQRTYLQTLIGFALGGGDRKKKRIVNLIGPKDTGKSTFIRILSEILQPYLAVPAVDELVATGGRPTHDKFALHSLFGARIAAVSETERNSRFRTAPLKAVTGGDVISTQAKYRDSVNWRASVMLLVATNEQIRFDVTDRAFGDRLVFVNFVRSRSIDRELNRKLANERQGILNWILQGVVRYHRDGLQEPESIILARVAAETDVATPLQFIRQAIEDDYLMEVDDSFPQVRTCRLRQLFLRYEAWCETEDIRPLRFREFVATVSRRYPRTERKCRDGMYHFLGIAPQGS